ncbi:Nucleotide-binding, alpha-beta plait [Artemisia annua]|uniref:Nucleotide-binding, alpha-beta plait n=1 Tax=Artemisia annua TaxID=35608 RepID=A0A2U1PU46_ARTAN|nr:Nucleotide-binding, alpha-beta plait [Artemisia annua]
MVRSQEDFKESSLASMGVKCSIGTAVVAVGKPKFIQRNETYNADFNRIRSSLMVDGETDKLAVCQLSNLHLSVKSDLFYVLGSMVDLIVLSTVTVLYDVDKCDESIQSLISCIIDYYSDVSKLVHDIRDENEDGIWRAPKIPNPAYKGPWKPKKSCMATCTDTQTMGVQNGQDGYTSSATVKRTMPAPFTAVTEIRANTFKILAMYKRPVHGVTATTSAWLNIFQGDDHFSLNLFIDTIFNNDQQDVQLFLATSALTLRAFFEEDIAKVSYFFDLAVNLYVKITAKLKIQFSIMTNKMYNFFLATSALTLRGFFEEDIAKVSYFFDLAVNLYVKITAKLKEFLGKCWVPCESQCTQVHFTKFGEIEYGPSVIDKATGKFKGFVMFVCKIVEGCKKALEDPTKVFDGCELEAYRRQVVDG